MFILFFLMGVLFVGLGWPLFRGRVGPNSWYGLRVGETMADEKVWYAANAYTGRDFVILGAVTCLLSVLLYLVPGAGGDIYALVMCGLVTVGALVICGRGMSAARKLHQILVKEQEE